MKVVQINSLCGVGCVGRMVMDLHTTLKSQGHQSAIGFGRFKTPPGNGVIRIGNSADKGLHVAITRLLDRHGFASRLATARFLHKIHAFNPDVLHLHNLHGYYLHIGRLFEYLKRTDKRVIWTLHDCWAFTGHCAHFDAIGCSRWKTGCHHCPLKYEYPKTWFLDRSRSNYSRKKGLFTSVRNMTIVTPSAWLAGLVAESFLREYPVRTINTGIDLDLFQPTTSDFRARYGLKGKFVLLGVAFTWDRKGLPFFVELAKRQRPDEAIVLVGVGDRELRELPPGIVAIRRTHSPKQLAEIYSAADLFVNPTLEDTFPTTNLEALACGTPVVTFDTGGCGESIDAECGIVVKRGDMSELMSAIARVKTIGKEVFSAKCREKAIARFAKGSCLAQYLDLYQEHESHVVTRPC